LKSISGKPGVLFLVMVPKIIGRIVLKNQEQSFLLSSCRKTPCQMRKRQVRGLRSQKKRILLFVN